MKTDEIRGDTMNSKCRKCGATPHEAAERGAYIKRVSPMGSAFEGECAPDCYSDNGDQDDALLSALDTETDG